MTTMTISDARNAYNEAENIYAMTKEACKNSKDDKVFNESYYAYHNFADAGKLMRHIIIAEMAKLKGKNVTVRLTNGDTFVGELKKVGKKYFEVVDWSIGIGHERYISMVESVEAA